MFRACSLLLLTAMLAGPAMAQTPIRLGQTLEGRLEAPDARGEDGAFYDVYTFRSEAAGTVTVLLRAEDFDAYLHVGTGLGSAWQQTDTDDDGGGGLNSRLVLNVTPGQTVVIRASGLGEEATGAYTLSVEEGEVGGDAVDEESPPLAPSDVDPARIQTIRIASAVTGTVASGADALFRFTPPAAGVFTIVLDTADFDPMIEVGTLSGTTFTPTTTDDDSGRGLNPLAVYNAEDTSPVVVRVLGFADNAGSFGLRVLTGDQSMQYADPNETPEEEPGAPVEVDLAQIQTLTLAAPISGAIEAETVNLYRFTPAATGTYTVVVDTSDFDPMLQAGTLSGTTFTPTATDDDGGRGLNPLLVLEGTAGDPVYVRVMGFNGGAGAFGVRVLDGDMSSLYADAGESYDGPMGPTVDVASATTVGVGTTRRTLAATAPVLEWDESRVFDLLRFEAPRAGSYTIVIASTAFDPSIEVGRAQNDSVFVGEGYDEDAGVGRTAALVMEMEAGTYFLRVVSDTLQRGPYTVEILEGDQGNRFLEANLPDRVEVNRAVRVRMGQSVEGALEGSDPVDLPWDSATDLYSFEAQAGQTVTFAVETGSDADPYVEVGSVERDVFTQLANDDDSGEGLNSQLTFTFERAGRYLIRVSAINKALGRYTLRVRS